MYLYSRFHVGIRGVGRVCVLLAESLLQDTLDHLRAGRRLLAQVLLVRRPDAVEHAARDAVVERERAPERAGSCGLQLLRLQRGRRGDGGQLPVALARGGRLGIGMLLLHELLGILCYLLLCLGIGCALIHFCCCRVRTRMLLACRTPGGRGRG